MVTRRPLILPKLFGDLEKLFSDAKKFSPPQMLSPNKKTQAYDRNVPSCLRRGRAEVQHHKTTASTVDLISRAPPGIVAEDLLRHAFFRDQQNCRFEQIGVVSGTDSLIYRWSTPIHLRTASRCRIKGYRHTRHQKCHETKMIIFLATPQRSFSSDARPYKKK